MGDKIHAAISACLLFHVIGTLALSTAIASSIDEYRRCRSLEDDTKEILFLSPIMVTIFTLVLVLLAGDEIVSVIIVTLILDVIVCTLGVKIISSH